MYMHICELLLSFIDLLCELQIYTHNACGSIWRHLPKYS